MAFLPPALPASFVAGDRRERAQYGPGEHIPVAAHARRQENSERIPVGVGKVIAISVAMSPRLPRGALALVSRCKLLHQIPRSDPKRHRTGSLRHRASAMSTRGIEFETAFQTKPANEKKRFAAAHRMQDPSSQREAETRGGARLYAMRRPRKGTLPGGDEYGRRTAGIGPFSWRTPASLKLSGMHPEIVNHRVRYGCETGKFFSQT